MPCYNPNIVSTKFLTNFSKNGLSELFDFLWPYTSMKEKIPQDNKDPKYRQYQLKINYSAMSKDTESKSIENITILL